ncbi:MAG: acyltransferase [Bacteroidales bacterium]|nr:acyltransferase [Bacteroidales bacterium]
MNMQKLSATIFDSKLLFGGIGMLLVLLYHQPVGDSAIGEFFYPALVGVDFLMFFSGYGLCYSYHKYPLGEFYKRRMFRIFPVWATLGFMVSFRFSDYSVWDFVCNMTGLYYYGLGGDVYEWYLAAILLFYVVFPLLYRGAKILFACNPSFVCAGILLMWFLILGLVVAFSFPWYYQAALGRLVIFFLGILCYLNRSNFKVGLIGFSLSILPILFLYVKGLVYRDFLVYIFAPGVVAILSYLIPLIKRLDRLCGFLQFLGKYSLEIYAANVLVLVYGKVLYHGVVPVIGYWGLLAVSIPAFILVNAVAQKLIKAYQDSLSV